MRKCKLTKVEIVSLYVNDGISTTEIAELAGVGSRQIRNVLTEQNVDLSTTRRRPSGHKINAGFFRKWTPAMAYVLGFILTDGSIVKDRFSIHQKERAILERINDAMGSTYPIRKNKNGKSYIHAITVSRKEMVADLAALGIGERKSLTVEFPDVPNEYMSHFIRGVIDGDGWVQPTAYVANVTSGSELFAQRLHEVFNAQGFNGRITQDSGVYRVWVSGKEDVANLGRWLYESPGELFLPRKRERMMLRVS